MLIEFSVTNFRSIKDKQTLSMVASADSKGEFSFETGFKAVPKLLRVASIYGANASGKSNLIKAMEFFQDFVADSARGQRGDNISVEPFIFSKKNINDPCEFEVMFIRNDKIYQYGFSLDNKIVYEEWLYVTPKNGAKQTSQTWFERDNENKYKYKFPSPHLKGEKEMWKRSTRDNALFLSTAVQLNSENLKEVFDWITDTLNCFVSESSFNGYLTAYGIHKGPYKDEIINFIGKLDLGIHDISVNKISLTKGDLPNNMSDEEKEVIINGRHGSLSYEISSQHLCEDGNVRSLSFDKASDGTKILFEMAYTLLYIVKNSEIIVVDELNQHLHPHILSAIVEMFQNKNINKNNAQLIFTGHETSIMNILRKDQIWITEKGKYGDTKLFSLSDFKGRNDDDYENRYNSGRYGGIPNLSDLI